MSNDLIEITCVRCGHTWYEDPALLDKAEGSIIYKGPARRRTYRVCCSRCGTPNIVTVEVEEEDDGQGTRG